MSAYVVLVTVKIDNVVLDAKVDEGLLDGHAVGWRTDAEEFSKLRSQIVHDLLASIHPLLDPKLGIQVRTGRVGDHARLVNLL